MPRIWFRRRSCGSPGGGAGCSRWITRQPTPAGSLSTWCCVMLTAGHVRRRSWNRRAAEPRLPTSTRRAHCGRSMISQSSSGRSLSCQRGSAPCWCCATGRTCRSPRWPASSAARPGRSRAPHPAPQPGWAQSSAPADRLHPNPLPGNQERKHPMSTDELEDELRSAFTRAAAQITVPEQARHRLLQRDYHPRSRSRRHRRLAELSPAGVAASTVLAPGPAGGFGPASRTPARDPGTIRTAAFTLTKNANGTATLTLTADQVFNPGALQQALQQDGIPALVETNSYCSSNPAPPGAAWAATLSLQLPDGTPVSANPVPADAVTVIHPAAMPAGTELFFGYFNSDRTLAGNLIYTSPSPCSSGPPSPRAGGPGPPATSSP